MKKTAGLALCTMFAALGAAAAGAQISLQPTPAPTISAENEPWYQTGEPVTFAGNVYYPAGAAIHFLPNEMVPSGFHRGVPLYSRTTIEPYSIVFLPVGGGMMQPYERRRAGDLAGTTGSSVPSFRVEIPSAFSWSGNTQAAAPPMVELQRAAEPPIVPPQEQPGYDLLTPSRVSVDSGDSRGVGTAGRVNPSRDTRARARSREANGIFVEFNHARWYSSAPPASLDSGALKQIGEWHGFPVYTSPDTGTSTIYIPIAQGVEAYAAYSKRK